MIGANQFHIKTGSWGHRKLCIDLVQQKVHKQKLNSKRFLISGSEFGPDDVGLHHHELSLRRLPAVSIPQGPLDSLSTHQGRGVR